MSSSNEVQQKAPASSHCFNSNWGNATLVQARWLPRFKCLLSNLGTVPALASINSDEETSPLQAKSPEEICRLFQRYMAEGDVESLLSIYDSEAVVLTQSGEAKKGQGLREQLASVAAAKPQFDFNIRQVIQSGDIALMRTDWKVSSPQQMFEYAIEVARRQPDGTWRWLIGDPFTVGKRTAMGTKIA